MKDSKKLQKITKTINLNNPKFYKLKSDLLLVFSDEKKILLNTKTGEISKPDEKQNIPENSLFEISGKAMIKKEKPVSEYWIFFTLFHPVKEIDQFTVYKESKNLKEIVSEVADRANDLNVGDDFDWFRGHNSFGGEGLKQSVEIILSALNNEDSKIRKFAGWALFELFDHLDHKCYEISGHFALKEAPQKLKIAIKKEKDEKVLKVFNKAIKAVKKNEKYLQ